MLKTLSAEFATRREAEMAVEHLTQEYETDPNTALIVPVSTENSAGIDVAGSDIGNSGDTAGTAPHPALAGRLRVSVEVEGGLTEAVHRSFKTYGGQQIV